MSCSSETILPLTAGQIWPMPVTFTGPSGSALDLTGATVHLIAKQSLGDEDAEAVLNISETDHADAAGGQTDLLVDLSNLDEVYFTSGGRLSASLWVEDSLGNRIPYGLLVLEIGPSAKWKPASA